MFRMVVLLTLASFGLQQFACCEKSCQPACAAEAEQHDHDNHPSGDQEHSGLPDGGGSHHYCVTTHLFYMKDGGSVGCAAAGDVQGLLPIAVIDLLAAHVELAEFLKHVAVWPVVALDRSVLGVYLV